MKTLVNVKDLSVSYFTYAGEVQSVRGVSSWRRSHWDCLSRWSSSS